MKKHDERSPDEIAQDLENLDFPDIDPSDLQEIFGGGRAVTVDCNTECTNFNCNIDQ